MEKKNVEVVILNYNGKQDTIECIESLHNISSDKSNTHIIVVDNASNDGLVDQLPKQFPDVELILNKVNEGFCEGNNIGIRRALERNADYIFILNNDTMVDKNTIDNLVNASEKSSIDICSPKIYFAKGFEFHKNRYQKNELGKVIWYAGGVIDWDNVLTSHRGVDELDHGQFDEIVETDYATGCAMLVKREVFEKIGMFDKKYFAYFEDVDLSIRANKTGYKIMYIGNSLLWHKNAASFQGSGSQFQDYFITRNRLIFGLRYAPLRAKLALLKEAMSMLLHGKMSKKQAVVNAFVVNTPTNKTVDKLLRKK